MALQHLQLLAVFEADDVIGRDRFLDGNGRIGTLGKRAVRAKVRQRAIDFANQLRKIAHRDTVAADMSCHNFSGQCQEFIRVRLLGHRKFTFALQEEKTYIVCRKGKGNNGLL